MGTHEQRTPLSSAAVPRDLPHELSFPEGCLPLGLRPKPGRKKWTTKAMRKEPHHPGKSGLRFDGSCRGVLQIPLGVFGGLAVVEFRRRCEGKSPF